MSKATVAIDIGGTFTDAVLRDGGEQAVAKVLTTPAAPEDGFLQALDQVLASAGKTAADVGAIIHGTTLATNAILERRGARVALLVTEGMRDVLSIGMESRFDQYDLMIQRTPHLVDDDFTVPVRERMAADGEALIDLTDAEIDRVVVRVREMAPESIAIGFLHAYRDGRHERALADALAKALPHIPISLSHEISPEAREYERLSTTVVNAYVRPLMDGYLRRLDETLTARGMSGSLLLVTSSGALTGVEDARRFPVRLIESGPAGGAVLAAGLARSEGGHAVMSFDMGGTTAKLCLIRDGQPLIGRTFEVDRAARFLKESGLPVRIPVVELVEIGAGGGSIAGIDSLGRLAVGPESAGADPGPACYGQGGTRPTVTDADTVLGKLGPGRLAGGTLTLDTAAARKAVETGVGAALGLDADGAARGIETMVDESMINAARAHAAEHGESLGRFTMVAFGGAGPLHAASLAAKLGIERVIIPRDAGVGSAVGFLDAPVAFDIVVSRQILLDRLDGTGITALYDDMAERAAAVVARGAPGRPTRADRIAYMRYRGQGHEIPVPVPGRPLTDDDAGLLATRFRDAYAGLFGRALPHASVEVTSWGLRVEAEDPGRPETAAHSPSRGEARGGEPVDGVIARDALVAGRPVRGPLVITEETTTTYVPAGTDVDVLPSGSLVLTIGANPREAV